MTVDTAFLFEERNVVQFLLCERANKYFGSILLEEIVLGSFFFHRLGQVFALLLIHMHLTARARWIGPIIKILQPPTWSMK